MIERGQHFGFALEAREPLGVSRQRRREHLDGDAPLQVGVGGSVHLAHATHADLGDQFIRAEACAGNQGQTGGNYSEIAARAGLPLINGLVRSIFRGRSYSANTVMTYGMGATLE